MSTKRAAREQRRKGVGTVFITQLLADLRLCYHKTLSARTSGGQTLVRDVGSQAARRAAVDAIINAAKSLGLDVIAEGVEEYPETEALTELKFDKNQGWVTSRPMPAEKVADVLLRSVPVAPSP